MTVISTTGNRNTGNRNTGYYNTGNHNTGNRNTGNRNAGNRNAGNHNTGNRNTGNRNTGYYNTGNRNTGNRNTGNHNTGNHNTGNRNAGNHNAGDYNAGNHNTGHYNAGDYNTGFFMTTTPDMVPAFDGAMVNRQEFLDARPRWMVWLHLTSWVPSADMTATEQAEHPEHETTGGYLNHLTMKQAFAAAWEADEDKDVAAVEALPGFDRRVWIEITGLDLWADTATSHDEALIVNGVRHIIDPNQKEQ